VTHLRLPADTKQRALALLATCRTELHDLIGKPQHQFHTIDVRQSDAGPTLDVEDEIAIVLVGPRATLHEPTLVANVAHESVHLHLMDGKHGNASGLEEGFALQFELLTVERHYGSQERRHHVNHLPNTYATALSDYETLLTISDDPARRVREAHGKLTGPTSCELRRLFPKLGWRMSHRLARRKRMRTG